MTRLTTLTIVAAVATFAPHMQAQQTREVEIRRDLSYGTHDGVSLIGDFYVPKAPGKYPVVVAVHGGGWQGGARSGYRYWGPYLAERGIARIVATENNPRAVLCAKENLHRLGLQNRVEVLETDFFPEGRAADRKSTRLNSSHT